MLRVAVALALFGILAAQPPPAVPDIAGTWLLDKDFSADLTKLDFIPKAESGNNGNRPQGGARGGGFGRGGFGRGGFGGGNGGGFGGGGGDRQQSRNSAPKLTKEEETRAKALAEDVKAGWTKLVISQPDGQLVINDGKDHTYFLKTDGSAADNHVGTLTLSSTTRVDGDHFATEWPVGSALTLVYTFTPVPNGKQLVVRVTHKSGQDARDPRPFEPSVYMLYKKSVS